MNAFTRTTALAMLASLSFVSVPLAEAGHPKALLVSPSPYPTLPKFGFHSYNLNGVGEVVTFVRWGGLASRLGLERGDIILSMNGYPLSYHGAWKDALSNAMASGGWVQLAIRDVRTGIVAYRQTFVGGYGPVTPHVVAYSGNSSYLIDNDHCYDNSGGIGYPVGPVTAKSIVNPGAHNYTPNGPSPMLKQIARLFSENE